MWVILSLVLVVCLVWLMVPSFQLFVQNTFRRSVEFFADKQYEIPVSLAEAPGDVTRDGPDETIRECYWMDGKLECDEIRHAWDTSHTHSPTSSS